MFRSALRRIGPLVLVASVAGGVAAQSAESLFEDGVDAFRRGDNEAAIEAFRASLANNPSNEDAFRMLDRVEHQVLLEMLMERGELGAMAERYLGLAKVGAQVVAQDPGGARDVVARYLDGDTRERRAALLEMQANYGAWAVPALLGRLGDKSDINVRISAQQALLGLGEVATVPLMAALAVEDDLTRTNVCATLGGLRDPRAAGALAWVARHDDSDTVRAMADAALDKLGVDTKDPATLSIALAEGWLTGEGALVRPYDAPAVAWTYADGRLQGRAVLNGLAALDLAELTLRHGLSAGGDVRGWLAAVHAARRAEIVHAGRAADVDADLLADAEAELPALDLNLALAGPARAAALQILLAHNLHAAAAELIGAMGGGDGEASALRAALGEAPAVAIAAALALGEDGATDAAVVGRLGQALSTIPDRMVVSIGDTGLSGSPAGWQVLSSSSVVDGLTRAKAAPPKDVVVIRDGTQGVTLDTMVFGLRNDPRTADVPIVVVTDDVDRVEALYGDTVSAVVARASASDVEAAAGDRSAAQQRYLDRALAAAQVLGGMAPDAVASVGEHVTTALGSDADDAVLVAVLGLAGRGRVTGARGAIEGLILDGASRDVQVAAMHAAAKVWSAAGGPGGNADDLKSALGDALASGDAELAQAAAAALGQLGGDVVASR